MINSITLVGRLTRDPETRFIPAGHAVCNFTLAVDRPFKNKDGEKEADFIRIVVWRKLGELCGEYLAKGRMAGVTGRLQVRNYENSDGQKRTIAEVVADNVQFIGGRKDQDKQDDPYMGMGTEVEVSEDDVPF